MAGTGLPIPKTGAVILQGPGVVDADRASSARAWSNIAATGAKIAQDGYGIAAEEVHQQQARATADFEIQNADFFTKLRDRRAGDPEKFENEGKAHIEGALEAVPGWMLNHAKSYLGGKLNSGLAVTLGEKRSNEQSLATESLNARRIMADADVMTLAAGGKGFDTPEFKAALVTHNGVVRSAVTSGLMAPEKADLLERDLQGRAQGEVAARSAVDVYREKGYGAAVEHLTTSIRDNDKLTLTAAERQRAFNRGLSAVKLAQNEDKADRGAAVEIGRDVLNRVKSNQAVDPGELRDVLTELQRTGATSMHHQLTVAAAVADATAPYRSGNLSQAQFANQVSKMRGEVSPGLQPTISAAAVRRGVDPNYMLSAAQRESGFNVNAKNPSSSATGLFQFTDQTWLAQFAKDGAAAGHPELASEVKFDGKNYVVSDPEARTAIMGLRKDAPTSSVMMAGFTADNREALKAGLGRDPSNGELYAAHFAGAGGALKLLKADPSAIAADILPGAAGANGSIFYAKDGTPLTAGAVVARLTAGNGNASDGGTPTGAIVGLVERGNVNLGNRPRVKNEDGSISTVRSVGVNIDGVEVLLPTVSDDGKILTTDEAVEQYRKTGKHLGKFKTPEDATQYAERLHKAQEAHYTKAEFPPLGEVTKQVQAQFVSQSKASWPAWKQLIDAGRPPALEDLAAVRYAAKLSGDGNWIREVETKVAEAALGAEMQGRPEAEKSAMLDKMFAEFSNAGWTPDAQHIFANVEKQFNDQAKAVRDDPVEFATRTNQGIKTPDPLNLGSPETAVAGVAERVAIARRVAQEQEVPVGVPLRPADRTRLAAALSIGKPEQAAVAVRAITSVPDDMLLQTIKSGEIKDALVGASRSTDPARVNVAMSAMDQVYQRAPDAFVATFGEEPWHRLKTWQSNTRYLSPDKMAEELRKADDPQVRQRREMNEKAGREIARKLTPDEVTKEFDQSWGVTPGFVARNLTGTQPRTPTDPGTRDTLMGDYETIFARRYSETLDPEIAKAQTVELMRTKWQRSDTNGGRLMLRAPEAVYPPVNGSHSWMSKQVDEALATRLGPRYDISTPQRPVEQWSYQIVSDRTTEAEAQGRTDPSYQIVVTSKKTGRTDILRNDAGVPDRFRWNVGPSREAAEAEFAASRARVFARDEVRRDYPGGF